MKRNFLFALAALALAIGLLPGPAAADTSCTDARSALLTSIDVLPQTLDELTIYTATERRAIFPELSPFVRSEIWREHLDRYVAEHPELSAKQLRVIEITRDFASPETYAVEPGDLLREARVDKPIEGFATSAAKVFTQEQIQEIFVEIGDAAPAVSRGSEKGFYCACRKGWNSCPQTYYCGGDCLDTRSGCGWLALQTCDGICTPQGY